jgi:predicted acylesterase/phospholipase RssA
MTKILVLSGGGSYGSFEVGVVSNLIEKGLGGWDLITGVSAGSINACYLSTIKKEDEKENIPIFKNLWLNIKDKDIYKPDFFLNGLSVYNTKPLEKKLDEIFKDKKSVRPVIISTTSLTNAQALHFNNDDIDKYGFKDLIMCSTAIPILFPPYSFMDDMFCDGGLTSNVIFYDAINYAIEKNEKNIDIDIIICGKIKDKEHVDKDNLNFKKYFQKLITIITQQVEYSQLLDKINIPQKDIKIKINVYEQKNETSISLLDFESCNILWEQGYDFSNVNVYEI